MADVRSFARLKGDVFAAEAAALTPPVATRRSLRADIFPKASSPGSPRGGLVKRGLDVTISLLLLLFLAPLLLIAAGMVRFTSSGPVLFWSERIGLGGRTFRMPKFRTMRIDAPVRPREQFADGDSYLTPVGNFLRRTSLDELPQLFSVLAGDMSLIGPRPLLPTDPGVLARAALGLPLQARPGVTGLAQIRGRNMLSSRHKARYDALYARRWSLGFDVWILAVTVGAVLMRKNII